MPDTIKIKGVLPYLTIVFLNAFTDLGHKIIIQNAVFKYYSGQTQIMLTGIINALILLPFVMLFTPSGFLSDKYPKNNVLKISSASAIGITGLITISYYAGWFWVTFGLTFLLAMQSAIYSPAKYGYIKELVGKENIVQVNAYVQAVSIVAILSGVFIFSILFESLLNSAFSSLSDLLVSVAPMGFILIAITVIETWLSFKLPRKREKDLALTFDCKKYVTGRYLKDFLMCAKRNDIIWLCIIGLSMFWGVNQVILASFGAYLKETAHVTNTVIAQGILATGGLGIILGSLFAGKASKRYIESGLIPLGAAGMALGLFMLPRLDGPVSQALLFGLYGIAGGIFIVPLNSLIQFHADEKDTGKVLAAGNFIQNIVMLIFLTMTILIAHLGSGSVSIFYGLFLIASAGAIYTVFKLPQSLIRYLILTLFSQHYKLSVSGLRNVPSSGGVLLLGNHTSWIDWAILQMACPRKLRFVMERRYYEKWYLKSFLDLFGAVPISSNGSKESLETVSKLLNRGEAVALFPEGHLSRNGQLSVFRRGFERAAQNSDAVIVPFYILGLWGSLYSFVTPEYRKISRQGFMRRVSVSFGAALNRNAAAYEVKNSVSQLSVHAWQQFIRYSKPIHMEWLKTAKDMKNGISLVDQDGRTVSHHRLLTAAIAFSREIRKTTKYEQNIGLLVPTSLGGIVANLALLMQGKTVVNLNYTATRKNMMQAIESAQIRTIITSSRFMGKLKGKGNDLTDCFHGKNVCFLEDLRQNMGRIRTASIFAAVKFLPEFCLRLLYFKTVSMDSVAAILFSSGSEGNPKGVMLTHQNVVGNIKQMASVLNIAKDDVMLSVLPLFHAFGLTVTALMPLVEGMPFICYPDPTNGPAIGKLAARHNATLLCATSTLLRLYATQKRLHPLMFKSLRMVISGAERLQKGVEEAFRIKFGTGVYEGYGATETSPVAGVNVPDILDKKRLFVQQGTKEGTVGLPLPGSTYKIVDPESMQDLPIGDEGLILIGGPQIMKGYLNHDEKTREVVAEKGGIRWYKTGDKGKLDEDGFLTIIDRYSRFAKIGGEMVSLGGLEETVRNSIADESVEIAAVSLPDKKKGEKVVLLIAGQTDLSEMKRRLKERLNPLMMPSAFVQTESIPKLGTGKYDLVAAKKIALELS